MPSPRPGRSSAPNAFAFAGTTLRLCPSNHILSAKSANMTGDSAASTDPPPPLFRTALLLRKTPRSQRLNSALKASETAGAFAARLRDLRRLSAGAMGGQSFYQSKRMSIRSMHSLCAMASRKCERARAVPDEFWHRQAVSGGSNIQKLEGCGVNMRKSLHRALFATG